METPLSHDFIKSLPKAELHCHLDGSLRPETIIELAKDQNVKLPANTLETLSRYLTVDNSCASLAEYLKGFAVTCSVMQTEESLFRATVELAEDCAAENIRYLEIRFSPLLHINKGLRLTDVVDAVLRGKREAERRLNIVIGIIICGLRHTSPDETLLLAELCVAYKNRGVVGFDLAGAERDYPAKDHREAFYLIVNNNINTTVHAGEACGPESIHQALHYVSANRIGHGTRLKEDGDLLNYVNDHRIPLEVCPTSNVQTKAVPDMKHHPLRFYFDYGLRITLNTDNRLISGTTLTDEYMIAIREFDFTANELKNVIINGFKSAFLSFHDKKKLLKEVVAELSSHGLEINDYI